ncbi:hypothetical protein Lepto782_00640 [Leptospira interrogans serovar Canicola]|uniref:Uncharacterized protein n=2 Tax=Leptospira interrogans TaxID=173 RepID=Q8F9Q9_LEPIN|nr:hypothetical protein LA_0132 [Leptospira interrogans serovar Lai str. 56601]AER00938.1 hypothetical protein LIF_A0120 [Leptospira interrogans serovar Lai str. IPAV]QOI32885.1 hypothetical protein LeptoLang_00635 [Leptospira interrogans serovar Icterohaemorrhagiae]QOI40960.1 hypothetical protein Lepto782_00640 [Leptospira interrogans serovar Canicola]
MEFSKINLIVCFNTTETNEEFIFQKLYSNFLKNILKNEYTHFKILEKHFD